MKTEAWQYKEVVRRLNRIEAKLDAMLNVKEVLVRPASLVRFNKGPKTAKDQL